MNSILFLAIFHGIRSAWCKPPGLTAARRPAPLTPARAQVAQMPRKKGGPVNKGGLLFLAIVLVLFTVHMPWGVALILAVWASTLTGEHSEMEARHK